MSNSSLFGYQLIPGVGIMSRQWKHETVGKHHCANPKKKKARKAERVARRKNRR